MTLHFFGDFATTWYDKATNMSSFSVISSLARLSKPHNLEVKLKASSQSAIYVQYLSLHRKTALSNGIRLLMSLTPSDLFFSMSQRSRGSAAHWVSTILLLPIEIMSKAQQTTLKL